MALCPVALINAPAGRGHWQEMAAPPVGLPFGAPILLPPIITTKGGINAKYRQILHNAKICGISGLCLLPCIIAKWRYRQLNDPPGDIFGINAGSVLLTVPLRYKREGQ